MILSSAFRLSMSPVPLLPGEAWTDDLLKYEFTREGTHMGTIYLDPYSRPNKFDGVLPPLLRSSAPPLLRSPSILPAPALSSPLIPPAGTASGGRPRDARTGGILRTGRAVRRGGGRARAAGRAAMSCDAPAVPRRARALRVAARGVAAPRRFGRRCQRRVFCARRGRRVGGGACGGGGRGGGRVRPRRGPVLGAVRAPPLPYKEDTSRPSLRTNWTRRAGSRSGWAETLCGAGSLAGEHRPRSRSARARRARMGRTSG